MSGVPRAAIGLTLLAACANQPQPAPAPPPVPVAATPVTICPGDPPPGYVCAPPILCRAAPDALYWDNKWITSVFFDPAQRQGAAMMILGFEKAFCGGASTPAGVALRSKLR